MVPFIITIIAILVVIATTVALWWWRISAKIAPYADELEKEHSKASAAADEHVVVVGSPRQGDRRG